MANEINLGYRSGATLTYGAYQPSGTVRIAAGTSLPEIGTTGYYTASAATIVDLDFVVVKEGTNVVAQGQYRPEVTVPFLVTVPGDLVTIETEIANLIAALNQVHTVIDQSGQSTGQLAAQTSALKNQDIGYFRRKRKEKDDDRFPFGGQNKTYG